MIFSENLFGTRPDTSLARLGGKYIFSEAVYCMHNFSIYSVIKLKFLIDFLDKLGFSKYFKSKYIFIILIVSRNFFWRCPRAILRCNAFLAPTTSPKPDLVWNKLFWDKLDKHFRLNVLLSIHEISNQSTSSLWLNHENKH